MKPTIVDSMVLPSEINKDEVLANLGQGLKYATLRRKYGEDHTSVENFKIEYPDWHYYYKVFEAWMDNSEGRQERFLEVVTNYPYD